MASEYPIINGIVRNYAIGFTVVGKDHTFKLAKLTRLCWDAPHDSVLKFILVEDGSEDELPRLKTREGRLRKLQHEDFARYSYELHAFIPGEMTAEELYGKLEAAFVKNGWLCNGGPV